MVASKEIQKREKSKVCLTVTVSKEETAKAYRRLLGEYSKSVQIKGFRKGHVPETVLEKKFGEGLKVEAFSKIMEESVAEVIDSIDQKPLPYSTPSIEGEPAFDFDKDFSFSVSYDVFPEFTPGTWRGIEIEEAQIDVEDSDVDRAVEELRERNALVLDRDLEAQSENGDLVIVDVDELTPEAQPIPQKTHPDFYVQTGGGNNSYGLNDEVLGKKVGDVFELVKEYPEGFPNADLAGKKVSLRLSIKKIKAKKLPDLDDDFAQDVSEKYKTMADLRSDLHTRLLRNRDQLIDNKKREQAISAISEVTAIELPESMVQLQLQARFEDFAQQFGGNHDTLRQILASSGKGMEDLFAEWRPLSEKGLKARLILERLIEDEKIDCSDEELEAEYVKLAQEHSISVDEIKKHYSQGSYVDRIKDSVKEDKLYKTIFDAAKIKKGKRQKYVDFVKGNE